MSAWRLPTSVFVQGKEFIIRSDFRAVLDALAALNDPELNTQERVTATLMILYPDWQRLPDANAAFEAAMEFVNCGHPVESGARPRPALIDWEQDVGLIAPAVDKVLGTSCRRCQYLHWWEFIGAFQNIGAGLFRDVVSIRYKRATGKKLDKAEQEFAKENKNLIAIKPQISDEEKEEKQRILAMLDGKGG